MLVACSGTEAKFLVRGLQGKLRIGLAEKTVVVSLAHAVTLTTASTLDTRSGRSAGDVTAELESAEATLRQVLCEMPCFDEVVPALLRGGVAEARSACKLTPGTCRAVPCRAVQNSAWRMPCQAVSCRAMWRGVAWRGVACFATRHDDRPYGYFHRHPCGSHACEADKWSQRGSGSTSGSRFHLRVEV
jgi:DNA ligase-1